MKTAAFAEHRHLGADAGEIIGVAFVNMVNFTISYLMKKNDHSQNAQVRPIMHFEGANMICLQAQVAICHWFKSTDCLQDTSPKYSQLHTRKITKRMCIPVAGDSCVAR